jgi:hypothetical protein
LFGCRTPLSGSRFPHRTDYLLTGNQRHFSRFWNSTKIISLREFIGLVAPHLMGLWKAAAE